MAGVLQLLFRLPAGSDVAQIGDEQMFPTVFDRGDRQLYDELQASTVHHRQFLAAAHDRRRLPWPKTRHQ